MQTEFQNVEQDLQADFYEEFERTEAQEQKEDLQNLIDSLTRDDLLTADEPYRYILTLDNEIEISDYISLLRERAVKLKCKGAFEQRVKAYVKQALKNIKQAQHEKAYEEYMKRAESFPEWWDGKTIDEDVFCKCFLEKREIKCINGLLYDINGLLDERAVENEIYSKIKYYCKKDIATRAKKILEALKTRCFSPPLEADTETIHLQNGTLKTDGTFTQEKTFCTCRLNVQYPAKYTEPKVWTGFLNDLLEPADILTLQEYLGYCLIPSTRAQKMLMIIGKGGEGKSRIGIVMQDIFGFGGLVSGQIMDLDNSSKSRFARAKLVSRLVFLDDDLDLTGLAKTGFLKQLVTAEIPLEVEDKHKSSVQTWLYSRVLAFGNGAVTSLYDKSDGFYRRQMILTTKNRPQDRKDDKYLTEKLKREKDDIFMWCFQGLQRLIANNYEFTISEKSMLNLERSKREGCNIFDFMGSKHDFCFDEKGQVHTKELYWAYENWCSLNALEPLKPKTFTKFLRDNADRYNIQYTENAVNYEGKRARGFIGIRYLKRYSSL